MIFYRLYQENIKILQTPFPVNQIHLNQIISLEYFYILHAWFYQFNQFFMEKLF